MTFAGFTAADLAAYFRISSAQAAAVIRLANGQKLPADVLIAQAFRAQQIRPTSTPSRASNKWADIIWGLEHLNQHPKGSKYKGDLNVVNLVANVATAGLYGVGQAAANIATGGKVVPNLLDATAVTGVGGSILQPTIGTEKTLIIEVAVASSALAPAIAAAVGPAAGLLTSLGKSAVHSVITNYSTDRPAGSPGSLAPPGGSLAPAPIINIAPGHTPGFNSVPISYFSSDQPATPPGTQLSAPVLIGAGVAVAALGYLALRAVRRAA